MRTNALEHGPGLLPEIAAASREAQPSDVVMLLRDPWRCSVMGAWLSIRQPEPEVKEALLLALARSHGSLDAPPLATAAVLVVKEQAIEALQTYCERDAAEQWGACGFGAAALHHLDAETPACEPSEFDRQRFTGMLGLAQRLRDLP